MLSILSFLSLSQTAAAFCGTYVGGVGSEFYNEYSQLAVVRDNNTTTLTIVNDIQGSFDSFALVIPVPEIIPEEKLNVLEPALFDRLDAYSQPRLVSYVCEDFEARDDFDANEEDVAADDGGADPDVTIEASYIVGEFEIVILSAEESGALFTWLNDNGYQVPGQSIDLLEEYIEGGSYFLAAKVSADAGIQDGDLLSPLQMQYQSDIFQIPIRIGTLNSKDAQDLIIYSLSPYQQGRVGIQNYPEFSIEDECMWESQGESFGDYYADQFDKAYEEVDDAAWTVEYAWGGGGCDPCSGTPPNPTDLVSLGLNEEYVHYSDYFFTRIHARYTPAQATQELMLYQSNLTENDQYRFIEYKPELEDRYPVCGVGMVEDPQSCATSEEEGSEAPETSENNRGQLSSDDSGCGGGCSASGSLGLMAWLVGCWGVLRRRESQRG